MAAGRIAVPNIVPLSVPSAEVNLRNCLTSDTKIELKSDTPETDVYFTLDGRNPEPFATMGTAKSTQKYRQPFCLPPGTAVIKAVAVERRTGKESLMITRTYQVSVGNSSPSLVGNYDSTSLDDARSSTTSLYSNKFRLNTTTGTRKMRTGIPARPSSVASSIRSMQKRPPSRSILTSSQVMSRAWASSIICPACCAPRLQGSKSKFCPECGAKYPGLRPTVSRLPGSVPTRNNKMQRCTKCQSLIPSNSRKCVVCTDHISNANAARREMTTNQPDTNVASSAKFKLQCVTCSQLNSPRATSCAVCGNGLAFGRRVSIDSDVPFKLTNQINGTSAAFKCPACKATNRQDSKFCASCGKSMTNLRPETCAQCGSRLDVGAHFCVTCGALASGAHFTPSSSVSRPLLGERNNHEHAAQADVVESAPMMQQNKVTAQFNPLPYNASSGKKPVAYVSAINPIAQPLSPGGGYWRQQLDHIASHLKAFAQSNKEFQTDVADQRIGKILDAFVDISADGVFSLRIDFELPEQQENHRPNSVYLKARSAGADGRRRRSTPSNRSGSASSARGSVASSTSRSRSSSATGRPLSRPVSRPQSAKSTSKPENSASSNDLLKELQMPDQDSDEVKRLLDSGANPKTADQTGMFLLAVAAKHNFVDAIGVLLLAGADINAKHPPIGNTALHEAAQLGLNGKTMIQELLRHGADAQIENKRGETPQAIALKYKHSEIADLLAAHVGQKILRKATK